MKQLVPILSVLFLIACSSRHDHTPADEWTMMDEFHMVMAESFHPYKDSANLEPAKSYAAEMATLAEKWASSELPDKVNNEKTKANLNELKTATVAFVKTVQEGNNEQIAEELTYLHDLFHSLQEAWYGGHNHEQHGHQH